MALDRCTPGPTRRFAIPRAFAAAVLILAGAPAVLRAQGTAADYARAERFTGARADSLVFRAAVQPNWIGDTDRFWYRNRLPTGSEFMLVDAARAARAPAFDHVRLATALGAALDRTLDPGALPIDALEFAADGGSIVVAVQGQRVRCDLTDYTCTRITTPARAGQGAQSAVSPDGRWEAFVREHDLYLRATESGWEVRLTHDGEAGYDYASPLRAGGQMLRAQRSGETPPAVVFWAPDSRRLITYRLDSRRAGRITIVQNAPPDEVRPRSQEFVYVLPEDSVFPVAEPVIFEVGSWRRIPVEHPPLVRHYYGGPSFAWSADARHAYVHQPDLSYARLQLLEIDAASGATRVVAEEIGEPYVDWYNTSTPVVLPRSGDVVWTSERSGWRHLYLLDGRTGDVRRQLTSGDWPVDRVQHVDTVAGVVYFTALGRETGDEPYRRRLYRVGTDGRGLRLLTPEPGHHNASFSPSGRFAVTWHSDPATPPVALLRRAADGAVVLELERADAAPLLATGWRPPEPFTVTALDGRTALHGLIWKPSNFDPARRYAIIEQVYTGPHSFYVAREFTAFRNNAQAIAELGFVVVQLDPPGTAGRSRAFQQASYRNLGGGGIEERVAAIRQLAAERPYMDVTRVGIYGHSAGGYDAVRAMLMRPDFYKVGVSSAGNHDHRLDKAVWNIQWMGWPVDDHYRDQSNVTQAHRLEGKLLLAHGDLDDNVPVSATLQLAGALIAADKDFDLLIMPNEGHGLGAYFTRRRWDFFVRHLLGVEPRSGVALQAGGAP